MDKNAFNLQPLIFEFERSVKLIAQENLDDITNQVRDIIDQKDALKDGRPGVAADPTI